MEQEKVELKPCPFCDKEPYLFRPEIDSENWIGDFFIRCGNCFFEMENQNKKELIDAWNKRIIDEKYKKAIEFIKEIAHESVYKRYENLNEMNWSAFELLKELGEI